MHKAMEAIHRPSQNGSFNGFGWHSAGYIAKSKSLSYGMSRSERFPLHEPVTISDRIVDVS